MKVRIRRTSSNRVTFQLDYSLGGKRIQKTVPGYYVVRSAGESEASFDRRVKAALRKARQDAEMLFHELKRREALGELAGPSPRAQKLTLAAAIDDYIGREGLSEHTRIHYSEKAEVLFSFFSRERRVASLTAEEIVRFSVWYHGKGSKNERLASTVNKPLRLLRALFNWLIRRKLLVSAPHIELLPELVPRRRCLTSQEAGRLVAAIHDNTVKEIVTIFLHTGLRRGELFRIQKHDLNLTDRTLSVESRKRGKSSIVTRDIIPLNMAAFEILSKHAAAAESEDDYLFGIRQGQRKSKFRVQRKPSQADSGRGSASPENLELHNLNKKLKRAAKAAGLERPEEVSIHVLRHTFASCCLRSGVNVRDLQALLRHRSPLLTLKIYCHESLKSMRQGVESLNY